jgi:tetratricopeptide (TPR) repeat protein
VIAPLLLEFGTKAKIDEAEEFLLVAKKLSSLCKKQSTESKLYAAQITSHIGLIHRLRGRYDPAISYFEDAMKQLKAIPDNENNDTVRVKVYLMERHADSLMMVPRFDQALELLSEAYILSRDQLGQAESSTHSTAVSRAHVMFALGDFAKAEATCRDAVKGLLRHGKGVRGTTTTSTAAEKGIKGTTTMAFAAGGLIEGTATMLRVAGNCFKDTTTMLCAANLLLVLAGMHHGASCRRKKEVLADAEQLAKKCLKLYDEAVDPTDEITKRSWEALLLLNKVTMLLTAYRYSQESEQYLMREVEARYQCRDEGDDEKEAQLAGAIENYVVFRCKRTRSLPRRCDVVLITYIMVASAIREKLKRRATVFGRLFN